MFRNLQKALQDIKKGKLIIITDDESRENEGDLFVPAVNISHDTLNFMVREGRGLVCVPMTEKRTKELHLKSMIDHNTDSHHTNFTVSVDAKGTTTGISIADRLLTIRKLARSSSNESDFKKPGHIFPLIAKEGGVLKRAGHTEAAVDLCTMAKMPHVGVICEIMRPDGKMARMDDLKKFAKKHNLSLITIKEIIQYRIAHETFIKNIASSRLCTRYGDFTISVYQDMLSGKEHVLLVKGNVRGKKNVYVRVHSECLTGDVFGSLHCDCQPQLHKALEVVGKRREGVILYMRQEGRDIGLANKIKAYALQQKGLDTVEANRKLGFKDDLRDYGVGAQILRSIGLKEIALLTNNPRKIVGLEGYGIKITKRVPIEIAPNKINKNYMKAKKKKLSHIFRNI